MISEGNNTFRRGNFNGIVFVQFFDNVLPTKECEKRLSGLKFFISINYEENHYRQMLNIVQILCNLGATYVLKATLSDYLVTYEITNDDGSLKDCSKLRNVNKANESGANIKIITFKEFMGMLGLTEEELNEMPIVSFDCLYRKDTVIKDRKTSKILGIKKDKQIEANRVSSNLGDLYGDFFSEFINKDDD